jgi:hypothetical protein
VNRHRVLSTLAGLARVSFGLGTALLQPLVAVAGPAVSQPDQPEGVALNPTTGTYSVHRVPTRSLDEVLKSFAAWHHQVLADDSTADYSAEDGILSMECSACGLNRPSAIDLTAVDLDTVMAYEAGTWHIGIRSKDGTEDFFGVLRGELGPGAHDPARVSDDQRNALAALVDLYDLAYLTQNPQAPTASAAVATAKAHIPAEPATAKQTPSTQAPTPQAPTAAASSPQPVTSPAADAAKPVVASLATLAASGDIEGIQARRTKANARDVAHALETAYGARAREQMLQGQVDAALHTLSAGRQSFGKSPALRDREAHYVVIGDAYDRLRLAVKLDIPELQGYLQRIPALEPEDATSIERMLVRTLSNRIADQRAAGRKSIVVDLLSSGRELFPSEADQLAQGTPGVLPEEGVEMGARDTPTQNLPN